MAWVYAMFIIIITLVHLFAVFRKGLLSVAIVTSFSAFLSAFSPNYPRLIMLRMLVGVGLGGGPVYSSWFLEFVPPQKRGIWMVVFSTFWSVGTILEALLGSVCPYVYLSILLLSVSYFYVSKYHILHIFDFS